MVLINNKMGAFKPKHPLILASLVATLSIISLSPLNVSASASDDHSLFELSLAELLDFKVAVASSKPERIIKTPAIASSYQREDLSLMGIKTLKEALSFIPGFVVQKNRVGGSPIMIRGIVEGFNQKVLFLLDGVPYWMPSHSEIPLLGIPIEAIETIEVIRGPGAIYYGTNASAGVINVITRKNAGNNVALSFASNNKVNSSAYFNHRFSDKSDLSLSYEVQKDDGYLGELSGVPQPAFIPPATPDFDQISMNEEVESYLARYRYQNFNLMVHKFDSLTDEHNPPTVLNIGTHRENFGELIHANYTWDFEKAKLKLFSDYNQFYLTFQSRNLFGFGNDGGFRFANNGKDNYRMRSGATLDYAWSENLSFNGGIEFEQRKIEGYFAYQVSSDANLVQLIQSQSVNEKSYYAQADYQYQQWRFLIGGRYTDNSYSGSKVKPRVSAVYSIDQSQSLKLLHSTGFNSPNFTQLFISIPGALEGNPNLDAELVSTTDLAYSYEKANHLFVANLYMLKAEKFIQRGFEDGIISFFNTGKFDRQGVEIDYKHSNRKFSIFASLAYNHQGNRSIFGDNVAAFVPEFTSAIGYSYFINDEHTIGSSLRTTSQRNQADSMMLLNLNYQFVVNDLSIDFGIKNLLDEKVIYPDTFDFIDEHLIEGGDGRNFLVSLNYQF